MLSQEGLPAEPTQRPATLPLSPTLLPHPPLATELHLGQPQAPLSTKALEVPLGEEEVVNYKCREAVRTCFSKFSLATAKSWGEEEEQPLKGQASKYRALCRGENREASYRT